VWVTGLAGAEARTGGYLLDHPERASAFMRILEKTNATERDVMLQARLLCVAPINGSQLELTDEQ
jgi:hypothetical protein